MSSAGGRPSWQKMASVRTSIVPPGPCPPPADTPDTSPAAMKQQLTASFHDFAVSLTRPLSLLLPQRNYSTKLAAVVKCHSQQPRARRQTLSGQIEDILSIGR